MRKPSDLLPLLPVAIALGTFVPAIWGDFVRDDVLLIQSNELLHDFDLKRVLWDNYWGPDRNDTNYRPLILLSYALNHQVSSEAAGFHLVNVMLNAAVAFLVFLVLRELLRDGPLAALGASLYAVLPIHTEAVANIVGRAELLAALAVLGAWLIQIRTVGAESWSSAVWAALLVFLGLCCKESTAVAWPLFLTVPLLLGRRVPWRTLGATLVAGVLYAAIRFTVIWENLIRAREGKASVATLTDNPLGWQFCDVATSAANALRLLGLYAWKTVVPVHLSADYSYNQIPVLPLTDPSLWLGILAFLVPLALGIWYFRRRLPLAALALVLFPLTFVITSNVFFPIGTIFGERLAYLPSLAFPLLLLALLQVVSIRRWLPRPAVYTFLALLVCLYAARSVVRNLDWRTPDILAAKTARDSPNSTRAALLGSAVALRRALKADSPEEKRRLFEEAHRWVQRSLEIYPENGRAYGRRARILLRQAELAESVGNAKEARRLFEAAERTFSKALEVLARNVQSEPLFRRLRGQALLPLKRYDEAATELETYLATLQHRGAPTDPLGLNFLAVAWGNQAQALSQQGKASEARQRLLESLRCLNLALKLRDDLPELFNNRGFCRFLLGDFKGAIEDYRRGMEICRKKGDFYDPAKRETVHFFHGWIAEAYKRLGDQAAAEKEREKAAAIRAKYKRSRQP